MNVGCRFSAKVSAAAWRASTHATHLEVAAKTVARLFVALVAQHLDLAKLKFLYLFVHRLKERELDACRQDGLRKAESVAAVAVSLLDTVAHKAMSLLHLIPLLSVCLNLPYFRIAARYVVSERELVAAQPDGLLEVEDDPYALVTGQARRAPFALVLLEEVVGVFAR